MNFKLRFAPPDIAITKTGAAADNLEVFLTLAMAKAHLRHATDEAVAKLKAASKAALAVREKDLPVEKPEAERGEDRPR